MPPFLLSISKFECFLADFSAGVLPRSEWNHTAHLAVAAATIHDGGTISQVRERILAYNASQNIVSTPDYGYHETVTQFWVQRIQELLSALDRDATRYDSARTAVAAFAHRGRLFDSYYSYDIVASRDARAVYHAPDK